MQRTKRLAAAAALGLCLVSTASHAQFMGIFNGVASAVNQVTGKIGNKITGGETAKDIEAERQKFFSQFETQTAGMDAASKQQLMVSMEKSWGLTENALLMSNAQAQRAKDAPLLDIKQVALDSVGGFAAHAGLSAGLGGGLGDVMRSATMEGVIDGLGGPATGAATMRPGLPVAAAGDLGEATAAGITTGATGAVSKTVTNSVSSTVGGWAGKLGLGGAKSANFEATDALSPVLFLSKHPAELRAQDLYRENGFLGWKRIDASTDLGAEAYAPIAGDDRVKAAVFNYDKSTGLVIVAFRVLAVGPTQFTQVVEAYSRQLGAAPRYASTGSVLRAVWEGGAFVTADAEKVSAGWSHLVPAVYAAASGQVAAR